MQKAGCSWALRLSQSRDVQALSMVVGLPALAQRAEVAQVEVAQAALAQAELRELEEVVLALLVVESPRRRAQPTSIAIFQMTSAAPRMATGFVAHARKLARTFICPCAPAT
jgi:hypothetical protein